MDRRIERHDLWASLWRILEDDADGWALKSRRVRFPWGFYVFSLLSTSYLTAISIGDFRVKAHTLDNKDRPKKGYPIDCDQQGPHRPFLHSMSTINLEILLGQSAFCWGEVIKCMSTFSSLFFCRFNVLTFHRFGLSVKLTLPIVLIISSHFRTVLWRRSNRSINKRKFN